MKTMLFMRHGKSDWQAGYGADHERPLAERGETSARAMGRALAAAGYLPHFVLSSTAVRARTTAVLALEASGRSVPMRQDRSLYEGDASRVIDLVRHVPEDDGGVHIDRLLVTGHEPTWSDTVSRLIGGGELRFVTAAVACVGCDVDRWTQVRPGACELLWFLTPKLLAGIG